MHTLACLHGLFPQLRVRLGQNLLHGGCHYHSSLFPILALQTKWKSFLHCFSISVKLVTSNPEGLAPCAHSLPSSLSSSPPSASTPKAICSLIRPTATGRLPGSRIPPPRCASPAVLHFRRTLTLAAVPAAYPVRVSADNRFVLYVNGRRAGDGPARGDLAHWRYERFDLAPLLQPGENLITATVWNFGIYAPIAQISDRTAFLLESEATGDSVHQHPQMAGKSSRRRPAAPLIGR